MSPRLLDVHGHAKGEHKTFLAERPIAYTARMLFLWFYHAARNGLSVSLSDHVNLITRRDSLAVKAVRQALLLARDGDAVRAAQISDVWPEQAEVVGAALRGGMTCSIGVEADNDPRTPKYAAEVLEQLGPDRVIRSVHFLWVDDWSWAFDNPEFIEYFRFVGVEKAWLLYIEQLLLDISTLPTDIVAHFYVPAKFGHWPRLDFLDEYEDRLLQICRARGLAVEFNTRFLYRSDSSSQKDCYMEAHRRLLGKAKRSGVRIALGSDAHGPSDQGRGFEAALALVQKCGCSELLIGKSPALGVIR